MFRAAAISAAVSPRSASLAKAVSADAGATARLARAGASLGLFEEVPPNRYALTPLGKWLVTGEGSLRDHAVILVEPAQLRPLERLATAIRTGQPTARATLGRDVWEYYREHPDEGDRFAGAMTGLSASFAGPVTAAFDTAPYKRIVDVGGGHGNLLRALLGRAPHATGVLFDLPEVAGGAADALADLPVEIVGGSFLDGVPADGDLYFLQHVLHDWDDNDAAKILRNCRRAGRPGHTLAVVELCLPERPTGWLPFLLDLHMLVVSGGRERTAEEFRALLAGAGYQLEKVIGLVGGQNILVARA